MTPLDTRCNILSADAYMRFIPATRSTQTSICRRRSPEAIYYDPAIYRNSTAKASTSETLLLPLTDSIVIGVALFLIVIGIGLFLYFNREKFIESHANIINFNKKANFVENVIKLKLIF